MQPMTGYTPAPNCCRGTIDIIWSCLATVVLCTFSALHLNLPKTGTDKTDRFLRIVGYTAASILMPEVNLVTAFRELSVVRRMVAIAARDGYSLLPIQAHLIYMKGLKIQKLSVKDEKDNEQLVMINIHNFMTALKILKIQSSFPTKDEIQERSKSDFLGRVLTIL